MQISPDSSLWFLFYWLSTVNLLRPSFVPWICLPPPSDLNCSPVHGPFVYSSCLALCLPPVGCLHASVHPVTKCLALWLKISASTLLDIKLIESLTTTVPVWLFVRFFSWTICLNSWSCQFLILLINHLNLLLTCYLLLQTKYYSVALSMFGYWKDFAVALTYHITFSGPANVSMLRCLNNVVEIIPAEPQHISFRM